MTENYDEIRERAFTDGSISDADTFFYVCVRNAFPTMNFRDLSLTHLLAERRIVKGKSANHIFTIYEGGTEKERYFEVRYHRFREGVTPDRRVVLEYHTLEFVRYAE